MKVQEIIENAIVPKEKLKSKVFWKIPKMKRTVPPFSKGAFAKLIDVTGGEQIEDPVGGEVVSKSNSMKKSTIGKKTIKTGKKTRS